MLRMPPQVLCCNFGFAAHSLKVKGFWCVFEGIRHSARCTRLQSGSVQIRSSGNWASAEVPEWKGKTTCVIEVVVRFDGSPMYHANSC